VFVLTLKTVHSYIFVIPFGL